MAILQETNHLDTQDASNSDNFLANVAKIRGVGTKNDQDWHAMMFVVLEDYVDLQEHGLIWDHHNLETGDTHNNPLVTVHLWKLKLS
jgi:hypothetical protein